MNEKDVQKDAKDLIEVSNLDSVSISVRFTLSLCYCFPFYGGILRKKVKILYVITWRLSVISTHASQPIDSEKFFRVNALRTIFNCNAQT